MIVFHHSDLDGHCSAAIIKYCYQLDSLFRQLFIECDYNKPINYDIVKKNEQVYVVDFSLDFDKLLEKTKNIVWIDHHINAIEKFKKFEFLDGIRLSNVAACELTWSFLFPHRKVPHIVSRLADYDAWKFDFEDTWQVQEGIKLFNWSTDSENWNDWLEDREIKAILDVGDICIKYRNKLNAKAVKRAYEVNFEGYKCLVLNTAKSGSIQFNSVDGYDIYITTNFDGKNWIVNLYNSNQPKQGKVDVGRIAKKHKGGGHFGASGFVCQNLPF